VAAANGLLAPALGAVAFGFALAWHRRGPEGTPAGVAGPQAPADTGRMASALDSHLVGRMPVALMLIAASGRIAYCNPAAGRLFPGIEAGQHYSAAIRAPGFVEAFGAIVSDGLQRTVAFTASHGRERYLDAELSALPASPGGDDEALVAVQFADLTRERIALQMRSDFVANASHELRTPLASIIGYIETLKGHARDDAEARGRFLDIMEQQAARMQRLIDDLLSLSRIEMNAHVPPEAEVDLRQVVHEVVASMQPVAERSSVALHNGQASRPLKVRGDRDQLQQVFANLIDNAIKYSGAGCTVTVEDVPPSPLHPGQQGLSVVDDGPGIARSDIPRLTERFYRVSKSASRDKGGTGLGLAITKHILNRHGGALEIRSTPGKGSRFTVWLSELKDDPVRQPDVARAAE
jgi:two-component system phosphate regulon sensor histidine kinase PhoR